MNTKRKLVPKFVCENRVGVGASHVNEDVFSHENCGSVCHRSVNVNEPGTCSSKHISAQNPELETNEG